MDFILNLIISVGCVLYGLTIAINIIYNDFDNII